MYGKLGYQTYRATERNLDVLAKIVENISNVNSIGYKKGQTSFIETLNGEISKHENKDFSQGPLRRTGELYDIALNGPGFFEVELPTGQRAYTRAGRLKLNSDGELLTQEGYRVVPQVEEKAKPFVKTGTPGKDDLGFNIEVTTPRLIIPSYLTPEITEDGTVNGIDTETGEKTKIGKVSIVSFNGAEGLQSIGKSYYLQTQTSGLSQAIDAGPTSNTKVKQGFLEYGNVDMATEFMNLSDIRNMITANLKVLKLIDKLYENVNYTVSRSA